jgi:hypothetical protein
MNEQPSDPKDFESQLKLYGEHVRAEAKALSRQRHTDVEAVLGEVRKQLVQVHSQHVPWWRWLSLAPPFVLRLGWAAGLALVLVAAVWVALPRPKALAFEFPAFESRGSSSTNAPEALDGTFAVDVDRTRSRFRLHDSSLSCAGVLVAEPPIAGVSNTVTAYTFEATGTNRTGESVTVKGRLTLARKAADRPARTGADIRAAQIAGTIKIGTSSSHIFVRDAQSQ